MIWPFTRPKLDLSELPADVWFVRSRKGRGFIPVRPPGYCVTLIFLAVLSISIIVGTSLMEATGDVLWLLIAAIGTFGSGIWFLAQAFRHGYVEVTYGELVARAREKRR